MLSPKIRCPRATSSRRTIKRRDTRPSRKRELGRYLASINWSVIHSTERCEDKLNLFIDLVKIGFNTIMPLQSTKLHINDAPWITTEFKELIRLRQRAFKDGDVELFKHYRNVVNRERKCCRSRFYASRVGNLKQSKPNQWWSSVKKIAGMAPASGSQDLRSQLHVDDIEDYSLEEVSKIINNAFLEPMSNYHPLESPPPFEEESDDFTAFLMLSKLNPSKASGPDDLPNWLLKEYAEFLAMYSQLNIY